ncbi:MAG: hypothetical protein Tsb0016_14190 [Sphingomonadales bacterium]
MKAPILFCAGVLAASSTALAADMLTPGLYQITTETLATNMPMAPQGQTVQHCITQEDIDTDPERLFNQSPEAQNCDVADFEIGGGKASMRLSCTMPGGAMTMTMAGSYTATSYDMTNDMEVKAGGMTMTMQSRAVAQRIGDCP